MASASPPSGVSWYCADRWVCMRDLEIGIEASAIEDVRGIELALELHVDAMQRRGERREAVRRLALGGDEQGRMAARARGCFPDRRGVGRRRAHPALRTVPFDERRLGQFQHRRGL